MADKVQKHVAGENHEKFSSDVLDIIDNMSDAIAIYDDQDRLVFYNQAFLTINPHAAEFVEKGMTYEDGIRANVGKGKVVDAVGREEAFIKQRVLDHRNPKPGVTVRDYVDGRRMLIKEAKTKDGGIVLTITMATDLRIAEEALHKSEHELLESRNLAEAANRAKSEFLSMMSHELRTPLNAILGFSQMLLGEYYGALGSAKNEEYIQDIHDSGEHLLELINDVLDLSAIEAGKRDLDMEYMHLLDIAKECSPIILGAAERGGINYCIELPASLPPLHADRRAIKQILLNLLANAVKFTPAGGNVRLSATGTETEFVIEVEDDGIGIAADKIEGLAKPFVRIESGPTQEIEGTGLGLVLVKSLLEQHHGSLTIESELGKGTRVIASLPNN